MSVQAEGVAKSKSANTGVEHELGVLLVHGLGRQRPGETLVGWGDALLKVIRRGSGDRVGATAERGSLGGAADGGSEAVIRLRHGGEDETWLLAEGWWADSFPAPSYSDLVSWSVRALPWSICLHVAHRYWSTVSGEARWWRRLGARLAALGKLLIALAVTPVFLVLLAASLLLGALPIARLRSFILFVQSTLTATVGDSLAFVGSPMRAALIRGRVMDGLKRLRRVCKRTVIMAHSQGAAVVLDALGGIKELDGVTEPGRVEKADPEAGQWQTPALGPVPDALVTFGAGTNQLASLKAMSRGVQRIGLNLNPTLVALVALIVTAVVLGWLIWTLRTQRITVADILLSVVLWSVALAGIAASLRLAKLLAKGISLPKKLEARRDDIRRRSAIALVVVILGSAIGYAEYADLPLGVVSFLGLLLTMYAGSMAILLSDDLRTGLGAMVRQPPGLERWIDLYASADPVPNGPTRIDGAGEETPESRTAPAEERRPESVPIWNRGSLVSDHSAYWENLDGFVLRVTRACAETAGSPWVDDLPTPTPAGVDERARWRVGFLRLTRWLATLVWIAFFGFLWLLDREGLRLPFDPPDWLPPMAGAVARFALLAALIGVLAWGTLWILCAVWRAWARSEQGDVLDHRHPAGLQAPWVFAMMTIVWAVVGLIRVFLQHGEEWRTELLDPEMWDLVVMLFGAAAVSTALLVWAKRHPPWPETSAPAPNGGKATSGQEPQRTPGARNGS